MTALSTAIARGTKASRPAAGTAGFLYYATDEYKTYRDNGSSWDDQSVGGPKIYLSKPTDGSTVTSTTFASFNNAWQITNVAVVAGQNIKLTGTITFSHSSSSNDILFAMFRGATQVATMFDGNWASGVTFDGCHSFSWIDENPGAGTYTYEIKALQFTSGTITLKNTNPTTDVVGGTSIFIAEVYIP